MPLDIEVKREMVRLLLPSSQFDFQHTEEVTGSAEELTVFILRKSQNPEPCDP